MKSKAWTLIVATTLFASLVVPVPLAAQEQKKATPRYIVTELGTLGGTFSEAVGINNRGSASGNSTLPGDLVEHGFFWRKGVMTDLGTLGGPNSYAPEEWSPNDRHEVAGFSDSSTLDPDAADNFCGIFSFASSSPYICVPFVWRDGVLTPLPTIDGHNAVALAINNRGQVAGNAENNTRDPSCGPPLVFDFAPIIWGPKNGEIHELPPLPGDTLANVAGINDNGQAIGTSGNCAFGPIEAVLWQDGRPINLGTLGGSVFNIAFGINNRGQVVGQSNLPGDANHHAFLWQNGVMTDLGTIYDLPNSLAASINNQGQVVGFSQDLNGDISSTVAWIWQDGVMTDLNTLIPSDSPLFLVEALGINDRGQIAGFAFDTSAGEAPGFVATPVEGHEDEATAVPGGTREKPRPALPESVRQVLQLHSGFSRGWLRAWEKSVASAATVTTASPIATLSPSTLTFSVQAIGTTSAAKTVTLKNAGTATLTIAAIAITGMNANNFSQTHNCGGSLAAGASCTIHISFKPTASGTRTATLSVSDNATGSPQKVPLTGIGTTAKLSPASLNFGSVGLGATSLPKTVTLTNVGATTLTISGIAITGTNASDFRQTHTCGSSLAAGASCAINLTFTPPVLGARTAQLNISDNAAGSPQKVALSGTGVNGGTLTGYCVHGIFDPHLGCRITSDTTQCPPGKLAINPVTLSCGSPFQGPFFVDEARSCRVLVNGQFFGGTCQYH